MKLPDELLQAMQARGLTPPVDMLPDHFVRFPSNGKPRDKAGWCKIFVDGKSAVFGDFRSGWSERWHAKKTQEMTHSERVKWHNQCKQAQAEAMAKNKADHLKAAKDAEILWSSAQPASPQHPYLTKKQVPPFGIKQDHSSNLIIPIFGPGGEFQSLQLISKSGKKLFFEGSTIKSGLYWLQKPSNNPLIIYIGEGFASLASVALSQPKNIGVVCAFSANNLLAVAQSIRSEYPDATLIICGDDDRKTEGNPGRTKAQFAAQAVCGLAVFPVFRNEDDGTDFNDMSILYGVESVKNVLNANQGDVSETPESRPELCLENGTWPSLIDTVLERLASERRIFDNGGVLISIDSDGKSFAVSHHWICNQTERLFNVVRYNGKDKEYVPVQLPERFGHRVIAARDSWKFERLAAITNHRILRPDFTILDKHGFDEETAVYLHHPKNEWPPIPTNLEEAVRTLWHPLSLMPYESPADAAAALALLLTAFHRPALPLAPAFIISANAFGSGKTSIGEVACIISGEEPVVTAFGSSQNEQEKALFSVLRSGKSLGLIDNVSGIIGGDHLAAALTSSSFQGRILGESVMAVASTRIQWIFTGVNVSSSADMVRRSLTIRLDPKSEHPELRKFPFSPKKWAKQHLAQMQSAALLILRKAVPHKLPQLGSFDEWDSTVRAAVLHLIEAGIAPCEMEDPLNVMKREHQIDPEVEEFSALLRCWNAAFGEKSVTLREVLFEAEKNIGLAEVLDTAAGDGQKNINSKRLGKYLARHEGRVVCGLRIMKGNKNYIGTTWRVIKPDLHDFSDFNS